MSDDDEIDFSELADELSEYEIFDISDIKVKYLRSKDLKKVEVSLTADKAISEMRLYCVLTDELHKLEKRLGIFEENQKSSH